MQVAVSEPGFPAGSGAGVLYVATGADYLRAARRSAQSLKSHAPDLPVCLFSDSALSPAPPFDRVVRIEDPHRRSKVDCLRRTPFSRTLYLDADTLVLTDIRDLFDILDYCDLAMVHDNKRDLHERTGQHWRIRLPAGLPQLNSGVVVYRRSAEVETLLARWETEYREAGLKKDQIVLRELVYTSQVRFCALPPEFNYWRNTLIPFLRPEFRGRPLMVQEREQPIQVRILHSRTLLPGGIRAVLANRIKRQRARLRRRVKSILRPAWRLMRRLVFH